MSGAKWTYNSECKRCGDREEGASNWLIAMLVRFARYAIRHGHCQYPPLPPQEPFYYYRVTFLDKDGNEIPGPETADKP